MNNELVPQPSWWKRNWKWAVPVGGCLTMIVLLIVFVGSILYGVTTMFEGSEPYDYAMEKINRDEQLIELLGSPIVKDGMVQGSLNYINGNGKANMKIPISGPKEKGMLYIDATCTGDEWTYHEIRVEVRDEEIFDLLEDASLEQF